MLHFTFLLVLPLVSPSNSYSIISCTDTLPHFQTSWKPVPSQVVAKATQNSTWYFEGLTTTKSDEIKIQFQRALNNLPGTWVYLEYFNDSPRRLLLETVRSGGVDLLPGDTSSGWMVGVHREVVGEITLTTILKKPQKLYLRKLVVYKRDNGEPDLSSKSCEELARIPQPLALSTTTQRSVTPTTTATKCNKNRGVNTDDCGNCPECICVCNCNCPQCN